MSGLRLGLTVVRDDRATRLSPRFGLTEWLAVHDLAIGDLRFVRKRGPTGRTVVDSLLELRCSDVIFASIGDAALGSLSRAGLQGWFGPADATMTELVDMFKGFALRPAVAPLPYAPWRPPYRRSAGSLRRA